MSRLDARPCGRVIEPAVLFPEERRATAAQEQLLHVGREGDANPLIVGVKSLTN